MGQCRFWGPSERVGLDRPLAVHPSVVRRQCGWGHLLEAIVNGVINGVMPTWLLWGNFSNGAARNDPVRLLAPSDAGGIGSRLLRRTDS